MQNKHTISNFHGDIFCPNCRESLSPADLEVFARCPFCDWTFHRDAKLEDFVISPIVNRWMARVHNLFPRE